MSVKDVRGDVASLKKLSGTRAKDPSKQYAEADKLFTKIKVRACVGPGNGAGGGCTRAGGARSPSRHRLSPSRVPF